MAQFTHQVTIRREVEREKKGGGGEKELLSKGLREGESSPSSKIICMSFLLDNV